MFDFIFFLFISFHFISFVLFLSLVIFYYLSHFAISGIATDGGSHWIRPLRIWFGEIDEAMGLLGYPLKCMEGESMVKVFIFSPILFLLLFIDYRAGIVQI